MNRRVNAHWGFVWIFAGNFGVHIEQVTVFGCNFGCVSRLIASAKSRNTAKPVVPNATTFVAGIVSRYGKPRRAEPGYQSRIFSFQEVIAVVFFRSSAYDGSHFCAVFLPFPSFSAPKHDHRSASDSDISVSLDW